MRKSRPALLLAAAAAGYAVAAWLVAPGFYDGVAPQQPYNWVSPPPQFKAGNKAPESGSATVKAGRNGLVDPGTAFTADGQASLSFVPGSFDPPPAAGAVTITLKPVADFPAAGGLRFATNVYLITASEPLTKEALITLRYSDQLPAPSDIYLATEGGSTWTRVGSTGQAAPFNISARIKSLGYFVAAYPAGKQAAAGPRIGGGQTLPILTAAAILIVVLAGVPLAVIRRRQRPDPEAEQGP